ncbi:cystinosin homolog, partial [Gastrolobium bilobum]|uniref:cystinosin homolog n=1 Tax=Gastrolobium bilobum TaxID=150636 RepID=UPI002AB2060B
FDSWSIGGYPQIILNFRRKSVVGLSLDFEILNLTKHWSYLIYNASLFFSPAIQKQYFEKYGYGQMIPVAANDVAFSTHSVLMNLIILSQIAIYERGNQKFSKYAIAIVAVVWFSAAVCFFIALPSQSWLWLISIFNSIQVCMTVIKYFPQRGNQKFSKYAIAITAVVWFSAAVCFFIALPSQSWLWLISIFKQVSLLL